MMFWGRHADDDDYDDNYSVIDALRDHEMPDHDGRTVPAPKGPPRISGPQHRLEDTMPMSLIREDPERPAVPLLEAARTLPEFRGTARTVGWRGPMDLPKHLRKDVHEQECAERVRRIRTEFTEAMNIIERDYDAAMRGLHNQHAVYDAREVQLRRAHNVRP